MNQDVRIEEGPEPTRADVPEELIQCLVDRMKTGRANYGSFDQWRMIMDTPGYRLKRLYHMFNHLVNIIFERYEEDDEYQNIGAVLFGCMVLLEFRRRK
jgi:hypothetical protein